VENAKYVRFFGHADAGPTMKALFKAAEMQLETVTREYVCSQFLRAPLPTVKYDERPCANEEGCICSRLASSLRYVYQADRTKGGFVCREFLLPSQLEAYRLRGAAALPKERQFCYLCHLYQTTYEFERRSKSQTGGERFSILQKFKVVVDKPGEYAASIYNLAAVRNHCWYGIAAPFPAFSAANYQYSVCTVKTSDGKTHTLRQVVESKDLIFH